MQLLGDKNRQGIFISTCQGPSYHFPSLR